MNRTLRSLAASGGFLAACAAATLPALALSVTVDGQPASFAPPPIERAGRVFVPLRGVFERLGASVVYAGGTINATSRGRQIQLHIGSTQATVDGQPRIVDVAPFVIGASTYVPLRFVSEALGAGVNYDAANQLVALTTRGGPGGMAGQEGPPPGAMAGQEGPGPAPMAMRVLRDLQPARQQNVPERRPTISANFDRPVDPDSVRIRLDGVDVTRDATRSPSGLVYQPPSPLQPMEHAVTVTGMLRGGNPFTETWRFSTGGGPDGGPDRGDHQ